ncbi:MAG TPA: alpha-ketoacid dehydrogenase subunit beta [Candidatus Acidoferrum sp.]|nr:alpha-ketoacid dehydrogenase subunit beta [Candidatus Acidoferrum sp.]
MASRRLTFVEAIVEGIGEEMRRDPNVFLLGQDIGPMGGSLRSTMGLWEEFGPARIFDTPISESAAAGICVGAALEGLRPILDISFGEFLAAAMPQIALHAPVVHWLTLGKARVPLTIRTKVGDGPYQAHPQCLEAWFTHVPGLKVVMPSTPADAKGLMKTAVRDDDPVLFFEHMYLYHGVRDLVPPGEHLVPIGQAEVRCPGRDVTVAATAWMVHRALQVSQQLAVEGIEVEVLDLRTLAPLDVPAILASVKKTGRLVVAHEAWKIGGLGAEVAATVAEEAFEALKAPILRVGAPHAPVPAHATIRRAFLPSSQTIASAVRAVMKYSA